MSKCQTCSNAIFNALWGEYKCPVHGHVIFQPELFENCEHYKNGTPKESKANAEYEARTEG